MTKTTRSGVLNASQVPSTSYAEGEDVMYLFKVSRRFVFTTLAVSAAVAFVTGSVCRNLYLERHLEQIRQYQQSSNLLFSLDYTGKGSYEDQDVVRSKIMPNPVLHRSKMMPRTRYTSMTYPAENKSVRGSHNAYIQPNLENECTLDEGGVCVNKDFTVGEEHDTVHLPAGQHLLVDIKYVDGSFLDSEPQLAQAMIDVVGLSLLTLLSYHCHSLFPSGVSCVGVLLESHISFHTWPSEGVITLDLFTCGSKPLIPVVPTIEKLFAIPRPGAGLYRSECEDSDKESYIPKEDDFVEPPKMLWTHVLRGFRPKTGSRTFLEDDIATFALSQMHLDYKQQIASVQTGFQKVDIYDVINPRYNNLLSYDRSLRSEIDTYESRHPELFKPNRALFLDGVLQSTSNGDESYHEALAHPGLFAHPSPKRVAIIGGGEGATLREVLKHASVEYVKMIEIDELLVNVSRESLPGWSDCSDLEGTAQNCFDDPRADLRCEDALAWFIDRFRGRLDVEAEEERFDVIIMDALDPQDDVEFADVLYNNREFMDALYGEMEDDGILVMQLGASAQLIEPAEDMSRNRKRALFMNLVEDVGFQSVHLYEESHCGFMYPWTFLVACKSVVCRSNWFANEARLEVAIHKRMLRTISGSPTLRHFDGATMKSYQVPPKSWETVFCRKSPTPKECSKAVGYDQNIINFSVDNFEVKMSSPGSKSGQGVYAMVNIPQGSYLAAEQSSAKIYFPRSTSDLMKSLDGGTKNARSLQKVTKFMHAYGIEHKLLSGFEYFIDSRPMMFANHGREGTYNAAYLLASDLSSSNSSYYSEATIDVSRPPVLDPVNVPSASNVVVDRHLAHLSLSFFISQRNIAKGEEILCSYLLFGASIGQKMSHL